MQGHVKHPNDHQDIVTFHFDLKGHSWLSQIIGRSEKYEMATEESVV